LIEKLQLSNTFHQSIYNVGTGFLQQFEQLSFDCCTYKDIIVHCNRIFSDVLKIGITTSNKTIMIILEPFIGD